MPEPIFHLVPTEEWSGDAPHYTPPSLADEGFVHCSDARQVARVADALFAGRQDLLLVEIDPSKLSARVIWEDLYGLDEDFPHVYGPIDRAAVNQVSPYRPDERGRFVRDVP